MDRDLMNIGLILGANAAASREIEMLKLKISVMSEEEARAEVKAFLAKKEREKKIANVIVVIAAIISIIALLIAYYWMKDFI